MTVFRKRKPLYEVEEQPSIRMLKFVEIARKDGGSPSVREELVSLSLEDYHTLNPHPMEDYTIQEQLDAGVSLKETSVNLDSNDNLDYPENDTAEETLLNMLTPKSEE